MKLVSLNAWGGMYFKPLMEFVRSHAPTTDVFCFQETSRTSARVREHNGARMHLMEDLAAALPNFAGTFTPMQAQYDFVNKPIPHGTETGMATFVRTEHAVEETGYEFVSGAYNEIVFDGTILDWPAMFQYSRIKMYGHEITIVNIHGVSRPGTKRDTPERLKQSERIITFLERTLGAKILCGDFNLMPDTESIAMIERSGMRNLIKEFNITETRGSINHAKFPNDPQHFADYTFVSPGITVASFAVPDLPLSDHLPMILEFTTK